jgi:protein-tyrosine phosphatase
LTNFDRMSVLFVCLGNICRSPTGEAVFKALLDNERVDDVFVDSAGTIGYHAGKPADARMRAAAERRGIELLSRSREITEQDLEHFDLVIAMDRENLADIKRLHAQPQSQLRLLSDFLDDSWPNDVPDPYYGGAAGFEYVLDMIEAACPNILQFMRSLK